MNRKDKLTEATLKALRGKLDEVYIKQYVETFDELYDSSWGPAIEVLDKIAENDLEDELMNWLEDLGTEDAPIDRTDLNDYIIFQSEDIYEALGLDENGDPLDESKKQEARSHKEDNEKAAPRTTTRYGKEVKVTDTQQDLDNTFVGKRYAKGAVANNPYYGGQYYGTTNAEYRSKRNKTGQKRTSTIDMSKKYDVYKADTFETPVTNYQSAMNRYKSYEETGDEDTPMAQSYKKSAQNIVNKERERIANKDKENNETNKKTENKNDIMSFEDWVDYIDIKKEYPEWFKDKQELDKPFLDVIGDHMDELNRDYRKYKRSQSKKKTETIDENLKAYTVTVSDEENQHSFQFYAEKDKTLDDVFNEIYDYVIF